MHTPVKVEPLKELLNRYPNRKDAIELCDGFTNCFRLQYTGPRLHRVAPNLITAE